MAMAMAGRAARQLIPASAAASSSSARATGLSASRSTSRGMATGHHDEPPKVDFWKDPMHPLKWKEEHFVLICLAGWGCLIYGGKKAFSGGGGKKPENAAKH